MFSEAFFWILDPWNETERLFRNIGKKLPLLSWVTTQKSAVFIYFATKAWKHVKQKTFLSLIKLWVQGGVMAPRALNPATTSETASHSSRFICGKYSRFPDWAEGHLAFFVCGKVSEKKENILVHAKIEPWTLGHPACSTITTPDRVIRYLSCKTKDVVTNTVYSLTINT
jgi:hypothetical protein